MNANPPHAHGKAETRLVSFSEAIPLRSGQTIARGTLSVAESGKVLVLEVKGQRQGYDLPSLQQMLTECEPHETLGLGEWDARADQLRGALEGLLVGRPLAG